MKLLRKTLTYLLVGSSCACSQLKADEPPYTPWFTGTLLAPFQEALPKNAFYVDFYFYGIANTGFYGPHWKPHSQHTLYSYIASQYFMYGITNRLSIEAFPSFIFRTTEGESHFGFGDLPASVSYQLWERNTWAYVPGLLLSVTEIFPTGKYQKLNPKKLGTDRTGSGSFVTVFDLTFYDVYHLGGIHYIAPYLDIEYAIPASVHVKGFNAYGGVHSTHGTIKPGNTFTTFTGFEYSFHRHWAIAFDFVYFHQNKSHFSGKEGVPGSMHNPSSEQFSLAPEVEYNFSPSFGIIGGVWFTAAGRNSLQFASGIISMVCAF